MIQIGVTGGIGSGKSVVCRIFAALGIPVYDSDARARALMNGRLAPKIKELFGEDFYVGGVLDRKRVASKVFIDKELLEKLNAIVHPAVERDFEFWSRNQINVPYVIMESAILLESGFDKKMDKVVTVSAPEELCIDRVVARDETTPEKVRLRMANQMEDRERVAKSHFNIANTGRVSLLDQVKDVDRAIRQEFGEPPLQL